MFRKDKLVCPNGQSNYSPSHIHYIPLPSNSTANAPSAHSLQHQTPGSKSPSRSQALCQPQLSIVPNTIYTSVPDNLQSQHPPNSPLHPSTPEPS